MRMVLRFQWRLISLFEKMHSDNCRVSCTCSSCRKVQFQRKASSTILLDISAPDPKVSNMNVTLSWNWLLKTGLIDLYWYQNCLYNHKLCCFWIIKNPKLSNFEKSPLTDIVSTHSHWSLFTTHTLATHYTWRSILIIVAKVHAFYRANKNTTKYALPKMIERFLLLFLGSRETTSPNRLQSFRF